MNEQYPPNSRYNEDFLRFLDSIEDFISKKSKSNWISDIYKNCLKVIQNLPKYDFASIFILSNEDFLFEQKITLPPDNESDALVLYENLIEKGTVGELVNNGRILKANLIIDEVEKYLLLIPLQSSKGTIGLLIISFNNETPEFDSTFEKLLLLFTSLVTVTIENTNIIRDIDNTYSILDQKIAQRTLDLTQSQRELKAILDSVLAGIIVFDEVNHKIIKVNPIAQNLIGLDEKSLFGQNVSRFLRETEIESSQSEISVTKSSYESELIDIRNVRIPIIRTSTRLFLANKHVIIESFVDVSEIKRYQEALKEANHSLEAKVRERTDDLQLLVHKLKIEVAERERAEREIRRLYEKEKELNELKSRFVSMVSHEFRTPLTIIRSSTQMIQKFADRINKEEKEYYYSRIIRTVDYLSDLIENAIFIGKSESKMVSLNYNKTRINTYINNIVEDFKNGLDHPRKINITSNEDSEIYIDERLIWLILNNLLSNAVKYSDKSKEINIYLEKSDHQFKLRVQDYGIGIISNDKDKIFEHFFRGSNTNNISGTGLGLSVVKESVDKLNGKINIESELNVGTTVDILLPLRE